MEHFDLPLPELREYRPDLAEPPDLLAFWQATLEEAARHPLDATFTAHDSPLRTVEVLDVSFGGFGGQKVAGWLLLPRGRAGRLPCIVEFVGYGGGRGLPHDWLDWSAFGYAHLVMDTRGQGGSWRTGVTPDAGAGPAGPHTPGFLTLGLPDRDSYYYRRLMVDAVRAVDAARSHPDVDRSAVVLRGHSQGGGLSVAAGTLRSAVLDDPVAAVLADEPFLCHYRHAAEIAVSGPYPELVRWCRTHRDRAAEAFAMLGYFDAAVLAAHASVPTLFSVSLRDGTCPPSTVFAAYNRYGDRSGARVDKDIRIWEWNEHEGGESHHRVEQLAWLRDRVPVGPWDEAVPPGR